MVLEHSEDITTFAIKIKEFRGPEDHRHAWDCEPLRFFVSGEISSTSTAPADTDRIHIQYRHKIQTFVATVPIDYMQAIHFGIPKTFEPEVTPGKPYVYYILMYDTHSLSEKFVRTDRNGKFSASGINPKLETVRAALTSCFALGSYEIDRVWNYTSPTGLSTMDFGFSFHDVYSKPTLRDGFQAGLTKPLNLLNQQFKINGIPQLFTIDSVYCNRNKICGKCLESTEYARCSCDGKVRSAGASSSQNSRASLAERLKRKYGAA